MKTLVNFLKDEKGLETVEWAVIAALIVAALVGIITSLGDNVEDAFEKLESATTPAT
ncbi:MAG: Flp family type IVb pilin [Planctomycetota bacterium]|jgi:Flp pilus assembly pilin Flp